jgi:hypothetical protein
MVPLCTTLNYDLVKNLVGDSRVIGQYDVLEIVQPATWKRPEAAGQLGQQASLSPAAWTSCWRHRGGNFKPGKV